MNINTPYSLTKDLGAAYNEVIDASPDPFVIVKDYDVCGLTPTQLSQIPSYIEKFGNTGIFTCYTNRIGYKWQRYKGVISPEANFCHHIRIAKKLEKQPITVLKMPAYISGFFMVINKKAWQEVGGFKSGLLGVDDDFSTRVHEAGYNIYRMNTIYLWHTYRIDKDYKDTSHL